MSIDYQNSKTNATYNRLVAYQYNQDASQLLILILFVYPMFEFSTNVNEYRKRIAIIHEKILTHPAFYNTEQAH